MNSRPSCPSHRQVKVNATLVASPSINRNGIIRPPGTAQITKCEKVLRKHSRGKKAPTVELEDGVLLFAKRAKEDGDAGRERNRWNCEPEDASLYLANLVEAVSFSPALVKCKGPKLS